MNEKTCPKCGKPTQPVVITGVGQCLLPCGTEVTADRDPMRIIKQSEACQVVELKREAAKARSALRDLMLTRNVNWEREPGTPDWKDAVAAALDLLDDDLLR